MRDYILDKLKTKNIDKSNKQIEKEYDVLVNKLSGLKNIKIKNLEITNFNGFGSDNNIKYDALGGIIYVVGDENTGKTSCVIDALLYSIYDGTGRNYDNVNSNSRKMETIVELKNGDNDYKIERIAQFKDKQKTPKNYTTQTIFSCNGKKYRDLTLKQLKNEIDDNFGTQDDFENVTIISNDTIFFSRLSDVERHKMINKMFCVEEFCDIYKKIDNNDNDIEFELYIHILKEIIKEINKICTEYTLNCENNNGKISIYAKYENKKIEIRKFGYSECVKFEIIFKCVLNKMNSLIRTDSLIIDIPIELSNTIIKIADTKERVFIIAKKAPKDAENVIKIDVDENGHSCINYTSV